METCEPLTPGTYTFCDHTLLLDGVVKEVFVGKWIVDQKSRHLHKFPRGTQVPGGKTMCIVNLKRPLTAEEFRSVRMDGIHPVISSTGSNDVIGTILITADLASTLPNGM